MISGLFEALGVALDGVKFTRMVDVRSVWCGVIWQALTLLT